jgi:hypothetical protein
MTAAETEFARMPAPPEITEDNYEVDDAWDDDWLPSMIDLAAANCSHHRRQAINYFAGYIVRSVVDRIPCEECQDMLRVNQSEFFSSTTSTTTSQTKRNNNENFPVHSAYFSQVTRKLSMIPFLSLSERGMLEG